MVQKHGLPCEKFLVPSNGSKTHTGSSLGILNPVTLPPDSDRDGNSAAAVTSIRGPTRDLSLGFPANDNSGERLGGRIEYILTRPFLELEEVLTEHVG